MTEPRMVRDTRPVAQMPGVPRCEANGSRGYRWCRRDAQKVVSVRGGDGDVAKWRMCSQHANALAAIGEWRTDIGETFEVIGVAAIDSCDGPRIVQSASAPDTKPDERINEAQRYAMHRAFLNVTRPWHARGHTTWPLEPEYVSRMFEHVIGAYLSSSPPEGEDTQRLDWLESLVVDAAGKRFNIVDPLERGMLQIETWGSMDLRDLIDSARAAIPPQNRDQE